jgi:ADP-ribose pyrophosphatase YjhB (NUDIX family)
VLPKGRLTPEALPEQAARREISEEAGVSGLVYLADLGTLERLNYDKTAWKITHDFLYHTRQIAAQPTDPAMVHLPEWHPIDALPPLFWPEQQRLIETHRAQILELIP